MSILTATGLHVPGRLDRIDLALARSSLTLLVGPNGAGKTSLLHRLAGIGPGTGDIRIAGRLLADYGPEARRGRLSFLPASREMAWPLSARDLVALAVRPGDPAAVDEALAKVDAATLAARRVDRLSTGERARILLARALAPCADILLLDEPAANLDPAWQIRVMAVLRAEAARGAAVLASIHDLALARASADRVIVMHDGAIVADGAPADALDVATLAAVFGVRWSASSGWVVA